MRYFISISYRGKNYSGWQIQNNAESIEEKLEKALSIQLKEAIDVVGAGRTDAGVNASLFYAHFDTTSDELLLPENKTHIIYKVNAILPRDILVYDIFPVHSEAHARFDASSRSYKYYVHIGKEPFAAAHSHSVKYHLDVEKMNEATKYLIGTQDFSCFEKVNGGNATSICTLTYAKWEILENSKIYEKNPYISTLYLEFTISANRFLRNMVRAIVGSLIEIGRGRREPEWIKELIESKNRCLSGQSVPGEALFLTDIVYPYIDKTGKFKTEKKIIENK